MVSQNKPLAKQILITSVFLTLQVVLLALFDQRLLTLSLLTVDIPYRTSQCIRIIKIISHYMDTESTAAPRTLTVITRSDAGVAMLAQMTQIVAQETTVTPVCYATFSRGEILLGGENIGAQVDTAIKHFLNQT